MCVSVFLYIFQTIFLKCCKRALYFVKIKVLYNFIFKIFYKTERMATQFTIFFFLLVYSALVVLKLSFSSNPFKNKVTIDGATIWIDKNSSFLFSIPFPFLPFVLIVSESERNRSSPPWATICSYNPVSELWLAKAKATPRPCSLFQLGKTFPELEEKAWPSWRHAYTSHPLF